MLGSGLPQQPLALCCRCELCCSFQCSALSLLLLLLPWLWLCAPNGFAHHCQAVVRCLLDCVHKCIGWHSCCRIVQQQLVLPADAACPVVDPVPAAADLQQVLLPKPPSIDCELHKQAIWELWVAVCLDETLRQIQLALYGSVLLSNKAACANKSQAQQCSLGRLVCRPCDS